MTAGFTPLLAKDSNSRDPARVINISSIAGLSPVADRSKLAGKGNGLWSCQFQLFIIIFFMNIKLVSDHTSKAAGKCYSVDVITLAGHHISQSITSHPNSP